MVDLPELQAKLLTSSSHPTPARKAAPFWKRGSIDAHNKMLGKRRGRIRSKTPSTKEEERATNFARTLLQMRYTLKPKVCSSSPLKIVI
jgi:hypothetical protein